MRQSERTNLGHLRSKTKTRQNSRGGLACVSTKHDWIPDYIGSWGNATWTSTFEHQEPLLDKTIHWWKTTISFPDVYSTRSTNLWKRLKSATRLLWVILYLKMYNSTRLKNSITSKESHLSFKTTDLCCIISIFDSKLLELFEIMRSHPTLVVLRSRYSCAVCTQNHVFVREKSSSVSRFQRLVEPAE
jgi:hypothetical protein